MCLFHAPKQCSLCFFINFTSCLTMEKVKMRGNSYVKSGGVMNMTNYNINFCEMATST